MADSTEPTAATAVAAAANFAELEALSNPKNSTGVVRSKYFFSSSGSNGCEKIGY